MKIILITMFLAIGTFSSGFAQHPDDCEGCKDHPMFNRLPDFYISDSEINFNAYDMVINANDDTKNIEGNMTRIYYEFTKDNGCPSPLQIVRNYQNAVQKLGGKVVYSNSERGVFLIKKDGREIWVNLEVWNEGTYFGLWVIEVEAMEQQIFATDILEALNRDGFIALYINFDTNKSDIKPESLPIIDQLVELMQSNPELKISIEGHTDNIGDAASNKKLSEQRAKSVTDGIVAKGITAARISHKGHGMEAPVADNRTEEGRAKNRRVEIVKKS